VGLATKAATPVNIRWKRKTFMVGQQLGKSMDSKAVLDSSVGRKGEASCSTKECDFSE
jgi:hypothetical protein